MGEEAPTILTLREYLEKEAALEQEAAETFPSKFDECTFTKGALRQNLYVCRSCLNGEEGEGDGCAAICYSCSLVCHPKCELIDLGPRRDFCCDCGTLKYKGDILGSKGIVYSCRQMPIDSKD